MADRDLLAGIYISGCGRFSKELDLLSSKGKILAAMLLHSELSVKDIPHLSGVSFRTCFEQLRFLEQVGVIERKNDPADKRRAIIKLNRENLSQMLPNLNAEE